MTARQAKNEHAACRDYWLNTKETARRNGVAIPLKLTAMRSSFGMYFVEGLADEGEYTYACCAFDAKAKRISRLIAAAANAKRLN